jgi:uncharacterized membrane protein YbhN (UPF0104 family)
LLMATYPCVVRLMTASAPVDGVIRIVYGAGWFAVAVVGVLGFMRSGVGARLRRAGQRRLSARLVALAAGAVARSSGGRVDLAAVWDAFKPFFRWRHQVLIVGITVAIQVVSAYGGRLMLLAVGVDLPLVVHVFVWNLMFFIFLAPISVGTLGVREATFILVFGLFGVARETALAASFVGLASLLVTVGMGGLMALAETLHRERTGVEPRGGE